MRLERVDHGHTVPQKLLFSLIRVFSGFPVPDVVKTLLYRKAWFGTHMTKLTQRIMRGPSLWAVGERELFAAFCSRVQQCPF
jgi:hypothetical protein